MRKFRKENRFSDREKPKMHKATCSECGKDCEVPFKPTGSKPVFCSDCFEERGDRRPRRYEDRGGRGRGDRDRGGRRPRYEEKRMFTATCDNCGDRCEVPFRPTGEKPVYCNNCFEGGERSGPKKNVEIMNQLEELNSKMNQILRLLVPVVPKKKSSKKSSKAAKSNTKTKKTKKKVEKKITKKKKAKKIKKTTTKK